MINFNRNSYFIFSYQPDRLKIIDSNFRSNKQINPSQKTIKNHNFAIIKTHRELWSIE
ncbi:MAG: hypothetical protein ACI8QQ_001288 [Psychroserpens sp.]|jgi:hypothetical protein